MHFDGRYTKLQKSTNYIYIEHGYFLFQTIHFSNVCRSQFLGIFLNTSFTISKRIVYIAAKFQNVYILHISFEIRLNILNGWTLVWIGMRMHVLKNVRVLESSPWNISTIYDLRPVRSFPGRRWPPSWRDGVLWGVAKGREGAWSERDLNVMRKGAIYVRCLYAGRDAGSIHEPNCKSRSSRHAWLE